jgi:ribosomal protein S18 acetylase RimI-like enzyme
MKIVLLNAERARDIAALHIACIRTGFISSLGTKFVTALYEAIAQSDSAFGFIAVEDSEVTGFAAFATNVGQLYKSVIKRKGWRLALLLAAKMFSLSRMKKVFETLTYPARVKQDTMPAAELLSIAVIPQRGRTGLGTQLVQRGLERCEQGGIDAVKVLVATDNEAGNRLYRKCGFALVEQIRNHGILSNIYEAQVAKALPLTKLAIQRHRKPASTPAIPIRAADAQRPRKRAARKDETSEAAER